MPKRAVGFVCRSCGARQARWVGKCPQCGEWETIDEEVQAPRSRIQGRWGPTGGDGRAVPLPEVEALERPRFPTGLSEMDRVLGGGLTAASAVLIGGDPGVGKSTLALQLCAGFAGRGERVLYVSGEESPAQVRMRAERLGALHPGILLLPETDLSAILGRLEALSPAIAAVDSIQMVFHPDIPSAPGTVAQVRESAAALVAAAKRRGCALVLVGHVTKDGAIAGPRVLEHLVDTVLYFEGDAGGPARILRAIKNRFGATNEIGIFEMGPRGLSPVRDPAAWFVAGREGPARPGSVAAPVLEGTRVLLAEIQALVGAAGFGTPQRRASGLDGNRLAMILAVLERFAGLRLASQDVFASVAGGLVVDDPGADLALALAVASSLRGRPVPPTLAAVGEIGLGGEVRRVSEIPARVREAGRLGFREAVVPATYEGEDGGLALRRAGDVREALGALGERD